MKKHPIYHRGLIAFLGAVCLGTLTDLAKADIAIVSQQRFVQVEATFGGFTNEPPNYQSAGTTTLGEFSSDLSSTVNQGAETSSVAATQTSNVTLSGGILSISAVGASEFLGYGGLAETAGRIYFEIDDLLFYSLYARVEAGGPYDYFLLKRGTNAIDGVYRDGSVNSAGTLEPGSYSIEYSLYNGGRPTQSYEGSFVLSPTPVPEPHEWGVMMVAGVVCIAVLRRSRKQMLNPLR